MLLVTKAEGETDRLGQVAVFCVDLDVPFLGFDETVRDSRFVLENQLAPGQEKSAHHREVIRGHEIGGCFEETHPLALLFAKLNKTRIGLDGRIRQVAREIVKRLRTTFRSVKDDLYARRRLLARLDQFAGGIERNHRDGINGAAGAREKNVEDWQRAVELVCFRSAIMYFVMK